MTHREPQWNGFANTRLSNSYVLSCWPIRPRSILWPYATACGRTLSISGPIPQLIPNSQRMFIKRSLRTLDGGAEQRSALRRSKRRFDRCCNRSGDFSRVGCVLTPSRTESRPYIAPLTFNLPWVPNPREVWFLRINITHYDTVCVDILCNIQYNVIQRVR